MIIASPWSRGGFVCSQVFDHTSSLQFLERFLSHKTGREIKETNINSWRRTVCGDLTAAFQADPSKDSARLRVPDRHEFIESIHRARFKPVPNSFHALTPAELEEVRRDPFASPWLPRQEPGVRPSCALPYQLIVDGGLSDDRRRLIVRFEASDSLFGPAAAGSPFVAYARDGDQLRTRDYAVKPGDRLEDTWLLKDFGGGRYHLAIYGPNGFFREFRGSADDPQVDVRLVYEPGAADRSLSGNAQIQLVNRQAGQTRVVEITDRAYGGPPRKIVLEPGAKQLSDSAIRRWDASERPDRLTS
jgi:phospholipase C